MMSKAAKQECINPRTGRSMMIDKKIYDLFSDAITGILKKEGPLAFYDIVEKLHELFKAKAVKFDRSVDWYAISIKNDMESRGRIRTFTEKGKKLNSLSK